MAEHLRNCLFCKQPFTATRTDNWFDSRNCAKAWRRWNKGPLPTPQNLARSVPVFDRGLYVRAVRSARAPRKAIGYKLYCAELKAWLPIPGSVRRDGSRPEHDYFLLRPRVELPRVPLKTDYHIAWVLPGNVVVPTDPPYLINIPFAEDMSRVVEIGRRLRAWQGQQGQLSPEGRDQTLIAEESETDQNPEPETT